jgi:S-adenosylmethionine synthetase
MNVKSIFTSESVTEGHPDKACDIVSDSILDAALSQDIESRVAIETAIKNDKVFLIGELTTKADFSPSTIASKALRRIGYETEFNITTEITKQSPDISQGVSINSGLFKEQGAGDQGMMFGYACRETDSLMPAPIHYAHRLVEKLSEVRRTEVLPWVLPDGKSQVSIEYENGRPIRIETIVVSTQHKDSKSHSAIESLITDSVILPVCEDLMDIETKIYVNPTGKFVIGGPDADAGVTGRKIIVDTYGGIGRHGGGAFSGKDPSKVDRSAAYAARFIAKNIIAAGIADKCEVQLAYAIGIAEPVSVNVDTFGTNRISESKIESIIRDVFPLKPADIIEDLNLKRPIYTQTAAYGHFGRSGSDFTWENTDEIAPIIAKEARL